MSEPVLYGAAYSVYVRTARLVLAEKGVTYRLEEVDVFAPGGAPAEHWARHPFGRIPAFEHDGFRLYETGAITRYVDEAFAGPPLQPADARQRARMNQAISVLDNYAYRCLVWDIFVERVRAPANGRTPDEARIAAALPLARTCLAALPDIMGEAPFLAGAAVSLADLHAAPIFVYLAMAPEGRELLAREAPLAAWWERVKARPSLAETRSPLEA
ncbi:MAG TPA: glutathione S-transferase family protein [Stellaceae bacterium]|nr:glutathione S-transferase family protein [Stellaceae bacterium]